jgi:hypothetical protein
MSVRVLVRSGQGLALHRETEGVLCYSRLGFAERRAAAIAGKTNRKSGPVKVFAAEPPLAL